MANVEATRLFQEPVRIPSVNPGDSDPPAEADLLQRFGADGAAS